MTGLEKILEKINTDSEKSCASVIAAAKERAEKLEADANITREKAARDIIADAEAKAKEIAERGELSAAQIERQTLLRCRIEAVNDVLSSAIASLKAMPADEYFDVLKKLAAGNAREGAGVMKLSAKDLARLPEGFSADIAKLLPEGKKIEISAQSAEIDGGFILVYGDIDVNCTFDALCEDKRDILKEKICSIIF